MIADIQQKVKELLAENASAILTAGGVVGTVGTGILSARAGFKAAELIQRETEVRQDDPESDRFAVQRSEAIKLTWPLFLPPVGIGGVTIGSIILGHRISANKVAALVAAYGISERRFEDYKAKALEKLGVNKEEKLRDEIVQDRINDNPPDGQVIILGGDKVLCYDMLTGRYFQSSMEEIRKAENAINMAMLNHEYASLSEFYDHLELAPTNYTDEVGWNLSRNGQLEVKITTAVSPDGKPCLAIDFNNSPHPAYNNLY